VFGTVAVIAIITIMWWCDCERGKQPKVPQINKQVSRDYLTGRWDYHAQDRRFDVRGYISDMDLEITAGGQCKAHWHVSGAPGDCEFSTTVTVQQKGTNWEVDFPELQTRRDSFDPRPWVVKCPMFGKYLLVVPNSSDESLELVSEESSGGGVWGLSLKRVR
jgi:hypothetical protein